MKNLLIVLAVLVIIALILGGSFISRRNQMAIKREAVNAAWSQVDVVLQRRADLIPNLVETVKGIAVQEQIVFGDIAKARSALLSAHTPAEKIAANGQLDNALGRLLVVVENYPQLSPMKISFGCRMNSRGRKTASLSSGAATTRRCRTTTHFSRCSPTISWQAWAVSRATTRTSRRKKARGRRPR